jgi:hypothetical protein
LHTLLGASDELSPEEIRRVLRAVDFIRTHVDETGRLGAADPDLLEYPVYSTAYAVLCLKRMQQFPALRPAENDDLMMRMAEFLTRAQFDEDEGFATTHAAYGGWGFDVAKGPADPGHMDLAHTRRALQALRAVCGHSHQVHFTRSEAFLRVVQRDPHDSFDGGFYFSPIVKDANKGRSTFDGQVSHFRSYATATCDGILALLAADVARDDYRVDSAAAWLRQHDDLSYPEGVPTDHPEPWGEAIRYYHYAVRAEAYAALAWPGDWHSHLAAEVARHQADDGSFRNAASPLMKEDDPILCTTLAVVALTHCQTGNSGETAD